MPHIGKVYPIYNPGRILVEDAPWPQWFGTEYTLTVASWTGTSSPGLATVNRGVLPISYNPVARQLVYGVSLHNTAGDLITCGFSWTVDYAPSSPRARFYLRVNGVDQVTAIPTFNHFTVLNVFNFAAGSGWSPIFGSTLGILGQFNFQVRRWSDPAPPPPYSAPF
jgi:hypothetical protein